MQNKFFIPLTAIALFLTACSQDGSYDNNTSGGEIDNGQIAFRPMEIGSNSSEIDPTRAIQTTTATITTYGVSSSVCDASTGTYTSVGCGSYFYNEEITAATGRCKYYWPGSSYKISFFGYAPYGRYTYSFFSSIKDWLSRVFLHSAGRCGSTIGFYDS